MDNTHDTHGVDSHSELVRTEHMKCVHCGCQARRFYNRVNGYKAPICYANGCLRDEWSLDDEFLQCNTQDCG